MDQKSTERSVIYSNEFTFSLAGNESVVNFKWRVPEYNEKNEVIGVKIEKEILVTMQTSMIEELATKVLDLIKSNTDKAE